MLVGNCIEKIEIFPPTAALALTSFLTSHYAAKLCILCLVSGFRSKDALFVLLLFFYFLWSFRQNFNMQIQNCAPIQCTVWPRNGFFCFLSYSHRFLSEINFVSVKIILESATYLFFWKKRRNVCAHCNFLLVFLKKRSEYYACGEKMLYRFFFKLWHFWLWD